MQIPRSLSPSAANGSGMTIVKPGDSRDFDFCSCCHQRECVSAPKVSAPKNVREPGAPSR